MEIITRDSFEFFASLCRSYTGSSPFDSGQVYGYIYERPVPRREDPPIKIEAEKGSTPGEICEASATISLVHFLDAALSSDSHTDQLQRMYECFDRTRGRNTRSFRDSLEDFMNFLNRRGILASWNSWDNTYNYENDFDQDLQFHLISVNGEKLVAIQPHCGCDARGGYPMPQIYYFDENIFWDWHIRFYAYCENPETNETFEVDYSDTHDFEQSEYPTRFIVGSDGISALPQVQTPWGTWEDVFVYHPAMERITR